VVFWRESVALSLASCTEIIRLAICFPFSFQFRRWCIFSRPLSLLGCRLMVSLNPRRSFLFFSLFLFSFYTPRDVTRVPRCACYSASPRDNRVIHDSRSDLSLRQARYSESCGEFRKNSGGPPLFPGPSVSLRGILVLLYNRRERSRRAYKLVLFAEGEFIFPREAYTQPAA
jgi:hypothetical protein